MKRCPVRHLRHDRHQLRRLWISGVTKAPISVTKFGLLRHPPSGLNGAMVTIVTMVTMQRPAILAMRIPSGRPLFDCPWTFPTAMPVRRSCANHQIES